MRAAVVVLGLVACKYTAPDLAAPGDDTPTPDAAVDGLPIACEANTTACNGRTLLTCNADGTGIASQVTCPLTCETDHCTQASNVEAAMQQACDATAPQFVATAASTGITITNGTLSCSDCGSVASTRVEAGAIDLLVFCLSRFELPTGKSMGVQRGVDAAIVLFVAGDVLIGGNIDLTGGTVDNQNINVANGGSGGFPGGVEPLSDHGQGTVGGGNCGGGGGEATTASTNVGGGGGGGGYASIGAGGGSGTESDGSTVGDGGGAGVVCTSSPPALEPLIGGSGGGSGGDGGCSVSFCGRPGGGGGGAIQISATGTLTVNGIIAAGGGDGGFNANSANVRGGGGGGGAGGAILLEAPTISLSGTLDVSGGNGGTTVTVLGGFGATPSLAPTQGSNGGNDQGGGGGGGGLGRVRLNALAGATCPQAPVADPCTASTLKLAPAL